MKQISQHQNTPKSPNSPQSPSSLRKTTLQRQFYVCFCAKHYNSYSALYLHAKKKHESNLSMKCLKHKRHEWSGNVKNVYYEFVESEEMSSSDEESYDGIRARDGSQGVDGKRREGAVVKNMSTKNSIQKCLIQDKIKQIFTQYLNEKRQKFHKARMTIIHSLQKYICQNYHTILCTQSLADHTKEQSLNFIPHILNNFFFSYEQRNNETQRRIIKELSMLSDWLYLRGYCLELAVDRVGYEKLIKKGRVLSDGGKCNGEGNGQRKDSLDGCQ